MVQRGNEDNLEIINSVQSTKVVFTHNQGWNMRSINAQTLVPGQRLNQAFSTQIHAAHMLDIKISVPCLSTGVLKKISTH